MKNKLLLIYIVGLQLLDVLTTYLAIRSGARELNPVVNLLLHNWFLLLLFKIGLGVYLYFSMDKKLLVFYSIVMFQAIIINLFNAFL